MVQNVSGAVVLQEVPTRARERASDFSNVGGGVLAFGYGRAEFVVDARFDDEPRGFGRFFERRPRSAERRVFRSGLFYVDGEIVDQSFCDDLAHHVRTVAVGVEFYEETAVFDFPEEFREVVVDRGFSAANDDAV